MGRIWALMQHFLLQNGVARKKPIFAFRCYITQLASVEFLVKEPGMGASLAFNSHKLGFKVAVQLHIIKLAG